MTNDAETLLRQYIEQNPDDNWIFEELGRQSLGENAFPEQLLTRGKQVFNTASAAVAGRLCTNQTVEQFMERSDVTAGDIFVILPLLINLLNPMDVQPATIALIAMVLSRMGMRAFCKKYAPKK